MKSILRSLFLVAPLVLCSLRVVNAQDPPPPAPPSGDVAPTKPSTTGVLGELKVQGTSISEVDTSHLRVGVDLTVTPNRSATLESLRLTSLRLNGMPVYADPLTQPIVLVQGKETALPPLYVTVQFRDLTTTAPLREMIEKQMVQVQGQVVAGVKVSFLEKLVMHSEHPRVSLPFTQDVPVDFGVSPLERQAALTVLTVLEFGLKSGVSVRDGLPGLQSAWVVQLEKQAKTNLLEVESSYSLKEKDSSYPVTLDQLGFRMASGQAVTTAEARAPWAYDTDFLSRIKSGETKLVKNGGEILLFPTANRSAAGIADTYSLTHKDFTLSERGSADKDALLIPASGDGTEQKDLTKVKVRRRAVPDALTVISFPGKKLEGGFSAAPSVIAGQDRWEKVAVYRLIQDTSTGKDTVEVIQLPARRDGKSIHLERPVDSSFFGSPILVPEGVLGIVQDEETGAFLPEDLVAANAGTIAVN